MAIVIKVSPEIESLHRRLRDDAGVLAAMAPVLQQQAELTANHIIEHRMSQRGPETLGVRTGRLRRSLRASKVSILSGGLLVTIGSNVKYMGAHEFGFSGDVQVAGHKRKRSGKMVIFGRRRTVRQADVNVRPHKRHVEIKERAPIRRGIEDREEKIGTALSDALTKFYEGRNIT
jgi:hypothetical protein